MDECANFARQICANYARHRQLGISSNYHARGIPFHHEASALVSVPCGKDGAARLMSSAIQSNWLAMQAASIADGVDFFVRYAFRSAHEQALMIRRRLSAGDRIERVLSVIAAPGYSEHHTGCAFDLACGPSDKGFEDSVAYQWLCHNGGKYGFSLSYPENNRLGFRYEPWHWYCGSPHGSHRPDRIRSAVRRLDAHGVEP